MFQKDSILLHHSAINSEHEQYDRVRAYHDAGAPDVNGVKKWPAGYGCQYHFFLERSGEIIEANPPERVSWHAGSWKWNRRAIGVALAGDFRFQKVTGDQLQSLCGLIRSLQARFDITDDQILNHSKIRKTECPGKDLRELVLQEKEKFLSSKIEYLRKVIDRTEPPRKTRLQRALSRLLSLIPV